MIGATAARARLIGPNAVGGRVLGLSMNADPTIMEPPDIVGDRINLPSWASAGLLARPGDGLHAADQTSRPHPGRQQHWSGVASFHRAGHLRNLGALDDTRIRTPDQRLRVFVSSTLHELAEERAAVTRAVARAGVHAGAVRAGGTATPSQGAVPRLSPAERRLRGVVLAGVRLDRARAQISGLEDELELANGLPRLLYVKAPAPDRQARLAAMLDRIRAEGADSYQHFRSVRQLGRLVRDDLALLLSERFVATGPPATAPATRAPAGSSEASRGVGPLPVSTTSLIGREQAIAEVAGVLARPDVRLLTLTGPGGIGKSRLAVAVGERERDSSRSSIVFVPLASVEQPEAVVPAIARAMGADLGGTDSPVQALVEYLGDSPWLLILDNLEQVVDAAPDLDALLRTARASRSSRPAGRCWGCGPSGSTRFLRCRSPPTPPRARSRRWRRRHRWRCSWTGPAPCDPTSRSMRAMPPRWRRSAGDSRACRWPSSWPPRAPGCWAPDDLLARLTRSLDAVGTGAVDMPERQRTLRATVEWSVGLLDDAERSLLETVAVFVDGWTVEAAAQVAGQDDDRALDLTESLARHSLVQFDDHAPPWPRSRMLETVREFVAERLAARPDVGEIGHRHADYFRALAEQADRPLRGAGQSEWLERLQADAGNLAAAVRWYLAHDTAPLPHFFRVLFIFWELRDHLGEARPWVDQVVPAADSLDVQSRAELVWTAAAIANEVGEGVAAAASPRLASLLDGIEDPFLHAVSQLLTASLSASLGDVEGVLRDASTALQQLRSQGEPFWTAVAASTTGTAEMTLGRFDEALSHLTEVRDLGERFDNAGLAAWSRVQLGTLAVVQGRLGDGRALLDEGLALSLAAHSTRSVTLCLVAFANLAFVEGRPEQAALVAGAADGLRRRVGLGAWPLLRLGEAVLTDQIRSALGADRYDELFEAGSQLNQRDAVAAVRDGFGADTHTT